MALRRIASVTQGGGDVMGLVELRRVRGPGRQLVLIRGGGLMDGWEEVLHLERMWHNAGQVLFSITLDVGLKASTPNPESVNRVNEILSEETCERC